MLCRGFERVADKGEVVYAAGESREEGLMWVRPFSVRWIAAKDVAGLLYLPMPPKPTTSQTHECHSRSPLR